MVFLPPGMLLEFDDICEIREGSTWLRHGETAAGSEALTEGFVQRGGVYGPKPSFLCKAG